MSGVPTIAAAWSYLRAKRVAGTGRPAVSAAVPLPLTPVRHRPSADCGRMATALLAVAIAAVASGAAFHRVLPSRELGAPVVFAAFLPVVLACATRMRRGPRGVPVLVSGTVLAGGWLLLVSATLFNRAGHGLPAPGALAEAGAALMSGWAHLLEYAPPAPPRPDLLALPSAATWLAASLGAELALRTRATLVPLLPAGAMFCAGAVMSGAGPGSNVWPAAVLVGAGLFLAAVRLRGVDPAGAPEPAVRRPGSSPRRPGSTRRRSTTAAVASLALCLVGAAALSGPRLPGMADRDAYDLRNHRQIPYASIATYDPLDAVPAWLTQPAVPLFTVRSPGSPDLRLVNLDSFDGQNWMSSARFLRIGAMVPNAAPSRAERIRQDIALDQLPGPFLPAVDHPAQVDSPGLAADLDGAVLMAVDPTGPRPHYTVFSTPPRQLSAQELASAVPATGPAHAAALSLPGGLPEPLADLADLVGGLATTPFERAALLEQLLRNGYQYNPQADSGHTYGHLIRFLTTTRQGTSEQFAATFALVARALGLPTRLVVGFRPGQREAGSDTRVVRGRDVLVWPEVAFGGTGWLAFYPTPRATGDPDHAGGTALGETAQRAAAVRAAEAVAASARSAGGPRAAAPTRRSGPTASGTGPDGVLRWWLIVGIALLAGAGACVGFVLAVTWVRRRRCRTADSPSDRVSSAWRHTIGVLRTAGHPAPAGATGTDIAGSAQAWLAALAVIQLRELGRQTDRALFAAVVVTDQDADLAWRRHAAVRDAVWRATPRRRRWKRLLAPLDLHRKPEGPAPPGPGASR